MTLLQLRIITPKAVVLEEEIESITAPGADGEVTVLARHVGRALLRSGHHCRTHGKACGV
jgi:hypothetical protein